jgi:hypothetical protein
MKRLLTLFALLISFASFGQPLTHNETIPFIIKGQMLQSGKTYTGNFLDTVTDAGTIYLYTCVGSNGSLRQGPVYGTGDLEVKFWYTKISGTPAPIIRLESSFDSTNWANEPYYTNYTDTLAIGAVQPTFNKTWYISNKVAPYYRIKITVSGTQSSSYMAQYFLNKRNYIWTSK